VTALGATTIGRNRTWQDDYTLWLDATRKAPANTRAWGNAGHAALAAGRLDEARRLLDESHRLAPCYSYTLINLSVLERETGDLEASARWAEAAVRCDPGLALTHYYRGVAFEGIGRTGAAIDAYRRTVAIDPQHGDAWRRQGRLLQQAGRWTEAASAYEQAFAVDPLDAEAAMAAGVAYHHGLGNPARALERYDVVLRLDPAHYGATYQRAIAMLASGREDEALVAWQAFVRLADAAGDDAALAAAPAVLRRATASARQAVAGPLVSARHAKETRRLDR
jgi:tetratricopeptide (TPR) repeat protein